MLDLLDGRSLYAIAGSPSSWVIPDELVLEASHLGSQSSQGIAQSLKRIIVMSPVS